MAYDTRAGIYLVMEDTISALKDYEVAISCNRRTSVIMTDVPKFILSRGNMIYRMQITKR